MSTAEPFAPVCSVCQTPLDPNGTCPLCRAPDEWNDQIEAADFIVRRLREWHQDGRMTDRQLEMLTAHYETRKQAMAQSAAAKQLFTSDPTFPRRDECWSCQKYLYQSSSHCQECGAPITDPGVKSLRYMEYLAAELQAHEQTGLLTLRQVHEFVADATERIDALRRRLERERAPMVLPVVEGAEGEREPRPRRRHRDVDYEDEGPHRSFLEILLDPQTIHWLLAGGGALIVLGLVIWLASLGLFDNAPFVAVGLGVGNLALLGGGWALMLQTRHDTAGRALTLLACLVMPLNLWFYDSKHLLELKDHLWIAGAVCCLFYVASALILKDPLFVYVLVGGITLTGILFLAQMNRFGEVLAPVTWYIILGMICLHAERLFPESDGDFSRAKFGMAFYWCSVVLVAIGLIILLSAQIIGWLHYQFVRNEQHAFEVVKSANLPWTLCLVLAGTYAYIYSDLVVRKIGLYMYFAGITILWAEILVLALSDLGKVEAVVLVVMALTALAVDVFHVTFQEEHVFLRIVSPLGVLLSLVPTAYATLLHFRATNNVLHHFWRFEISWEYVGALAAVAICCRAGAFLYRHSAREISVIYFFLTAVVTLLFAAGLTWMMGLTLWEEQAPLIMIVPILYLGASYLYQGQSPEDPLIWCAHAAVAVMIFFSVWVALGITPQVAQQGVNQAIQLVAGDKRNLLLALFCLEAAMFYGVAAILRRTDWTIYLATVMICGAIWQFLRYVNTPDELYPIAFGLPGFLLLVLYRFGIFERLEMPELERTMFQSANALMTLGFVSGGVLALHRILAHDFDLGNHGRDDWRKPVWLALYLTIFLAVVSALSAILVQHQTWRRVYVVFGFVNGFLMLLLIHKLSTLSPWQRLEVISIIAGIAMLGFAYTGWYWETERNSDLVSMGFIFGSLALMGPLLLAVIVHRINRNFQPGWDDLGLIVSGVALFGSGVACRIKATTLIGSGGLIAYILVILIGLHRHLAEQWIIGIYLTLGGAVLFGTGLFLSLYRDYLLELPEKIRRREGVFRIFDWR